MGVFVRLLCPYDQSVRPVQTGRMDGCLYGCVTGVYGRALHTTRAHGPVVRAVCTGRVDRAPVHTRIDGPYKRPVQTGTGTGRQYRRYRPSLIQKAPGRVFLHGIIMT